MNPAELRVSYGRSAMAIIADIEISGHVLA